MRKIRIIALLLVALMTLCACGSGDNTGEKERGETVKFLSWTPIYNDHQCVAQDGPKKPEDLREITLTDAQIGTLVPAELLSDFKTTGYGYFRGNNVLYHVVLEMKLQQGSATVVLGTNVTSHACCASIGHGLSDQKSACGDATFTIYRKIKSGGMELTALGEVNDVLMLVSIDSKNPQNDKIVFERILESFSRTKADTLTLSGIKPN